MCSGRPYVQMKNMKFMELRIRKVHKLQGLEEQPLVTKQKVYEASVIVVSVQNRVALCKFLKRRTQPQCIMRTHFPFTLKPRLYFSWRSIAEHLIT